MDIKKTVITAASAVSAVTATGLAAKKISDKSFCPICSAKKLINNFRLTQSADTGYNNGVALTPPMGWSSWNLFRDKINENLIKEIADAMSQSGLVEAGYKYVNIDDCWQASTRDKEGRLQCDKETFPGGIKSLAQYVNSKGLKLGIYSSNGTLTCEEYPASLRNEALDADTFASWGIEYFKYDFCHNEKIPSIAPKVSKISFSAEGTGEEIASFSPQDVELEGMAKIIEDDSLETKAYIGGVTSRNGAFSVNVSVEADGEYILTLTVKKIDSNEKFLMVKINKSDEYHIYVPGMKNWTAEHRAQIKVKLCEGENHVHFSNPVGSKMDSAAIQYKLMGRELKRATKEYAEETGTEEKPIVYSICEWGLNKPFKWGLEAGNLWRTTPDIKATWLSVMAIYEVNVRLYKYSAVGAWNDPDMLEVGNGNLTFEENKSHFSLWCMMNAPLILGNDVRKFIVDGKVDTDNKVYQILTNKNMIAINQDELGVQCQRIKAGTVDILAKPLKDSRVAVCVLNKGVGSACSRIDLKKIANLGFLNLPQKEGYRIFDVWDEKYTENSRTINTVVEKHGVKVFIIE